MTAVFEPWVRRLCVIEIAPPIHLLPFSPEGAQA